MDQTQTLKMALNMFLGLSVGHWTATKLPTAEDTSLIIKYMGKVRAGRPFKILNAAARPPKRYRPTIYWAKTNIDLEEQTITFFQLKKDVSVEDLMNDWNTCVKAAEGLVVHRDSIARKMKANPVDANVSLRRQARKLARELLGPDAHFAASRDEKGMYKLTLNIGDQEPNKPANVLSLTGSNEREAYLYAIAYLATNLG